MNYAEYSEHQKKAEIEGDHRCECEKCQRYRRVFADELDGLEL